MLSAADLENLDLIIPISDHPVTGLKRKVYHNELVSNKLQKFVQLKGFVVHFEGDKPLLNTRGVSNFECRLTATNERKVDPKTGNVLPKDEWGDTSVGEYDYFQYISKYQPVVVDDLITSVYVAADNSHTFD